jgi:hypothetical protein
MNMLLQKLKRLCYTRIFILFNLSAVAFTFQACYGVPQDDLMAVTISGKVTDSQTLEPIQGIKVEGGQSGTIAYTDNEGYFIVQVEPGDVNEVTFSDVDGQDNRSYADKIAAVADSLPSHTISLDIALNPKSN